MNMKKLLLALGVFGMSFDLGAEAPGELNVFFGSPETLVMEEAGPAPGEQMCTGNLDNDATECWTSYRAVLVARFRKTHGHGSWT